MSIQQKLFDSVPASVADEALVEGITEQMTKRFKEASESGFSGWHTSKANPNEMFDKAIEKITNGDLLDGINYLAMVYMRRQLGIDE